MKSRTYGKKCKCSHFESDHINENKKFYEPNAIPEMGYFLPPPPTFNNPKQMRCRVCACEKFSSEKKGWI